jgi:hypothetical protein
MRYEAESYALIKAGPVEYGWCVKYGDDTVCDTTSKAVAEQIADALNSAGAPPRWN